MKLGRRVLYWLRKNPLAFGANPDWGKMHITFKFASIVTKCIVGAEMGFSGGL